MNERDCIRSVHVALTGGINYIDVSPYYGNSRAESILGKALRDVPRDEYILSTKAGRNSVDRFDFSPGNIRKSLEQSLKRLNLDYVDILFLHDIEFGHPFQILNEAIPTVRELQNQGLVRYLGVSGYPLNVLKRVVKEANVDVVLSYCHYTLLDKSLLEFLSLLRVHGVSIVNASPLAMGLLTMQGPPDWHPAGIEIREVCRQVVKYCKARGVDLAKLALQYSVTNKDIPTTLVSTADPNVMKRNIEWIEEPVDEELISEVSSMFELVRNKTWPSGQEKVWED
ncbi:oxidoreductase [Alicyclobacillus hesperidum subsp. aegles]|nr:oxidoreductase [Alicyclobacillus hesperidum subsp. aegles]